MLLGTVRRKLTALVAFSAAAALVVLPVLSWLMHRQLIDEVDDRVPQAIAGFETELSDDIKDLDVTAIAISEEPRLEVALAARDLAALANIAQPFRDAYPDLDLLFFDREGKLVGQLGCTAPRLKMPAKAAHGEHVVLLHGCETGDHAPVAIAILRDIGATGFIMVCLPLDQNYLDNAQHKLGGELALQVVNPKVHEGKLYLSVATTGFPIQHLDDATREGSIHDEHGEIWAIATFLPPSLEKAERRTQLRLALALDVTDIKAIVRRHLLFALAILAVVTVLSVMVGWRLASRMSRALTRVNRAMQRLEKQEYVKVDVVKTGDELEDLANGFNAMVDGLQERDKLRTTMGKYMTEAVVAHLLAGEVELGGKTLEVTILFCDLRDFTTLSEKRAAQEIVGLLNEYFTDMVECVMAEGGVVDKYIGDNIMAVFGAPVARHDDAARAVRAAVTMRDALGKLNERFEARGMPALRFGIGLHTGEVVAGNIGSAKRMEYTVIGDAVNLASRLESKTKEVGTDILISEATFERAKDVVEGEPAGEVHVKGREQGVQIYKVRGLK
ncbi:MAG: adenylate/guanylate cyclase domain-containing protein [Acidobacteriota bacterium]